MKNIRFAEVIEVDCTPEIVFDFTQDYGKRLGWDTFLKKADLMNGALKAGKGVKTYCVAKNGLGMITEYVTFNRPKVTAIKMTQGPYMFKSFLGSWTFKEIARGQTEVVFLYSYDLRFPFDLFSKRIKLKLQGDVRKRLIDLKNNIEH